MVDVDASGRVAVSYYDFRNDRPGDARLSTDFWITHSDDGGRSFTDESRLTPTSFDMHFVGDYTGLDHVGTVFRPAWVAANDGNLVNPTDVFTRSAG